MHSLLEARSGVVLSQLAPRAAAAARAAVAQPRRAGRRARTHAAEEAMSAAKEPTTNATDGTSATDRTSAAGAMGAIHGTPALSAWSRRIVRALAEVVLPDGADAPKVPSDRVVDFVDGFVPHLPRLLRRLFPLGLLMLEARRLRAHAVAGAVLVDVARAPPSLRRWLGARALAATARSHQGRQGALPHGLLLRRPRRGAARIRCRCSRRRRERRAVGASCCEHLRMLPLTGAT